MTYEVIKTQQGYGITANGLIHGTNFPYAVIVSDGMGKALAESLARSMNHPE